MTSYGTDIQDHRTDDFDVEALLRRAIEMVDTAKSMPLSASVIVPRDDMRGMREKPRHLFRGLDVELIGIELEPLWIIH